MINFSRYTKEVVIPDNIVIAPDVEGMYKDEAIASIENNDLLATIGGSIESEYIAAGKIIMQTPVGGAFLEKNGTVLLTISSGKGVEEVVDGIATVPYLVGDTKEDAIEKLKKAGLGDPIIEEVNDENITAGLVIESSIESGEKVEEGTVLTLKVSIGPAAFKMPNVVGQKEDAAKSTLENRGLVVTVEYAKSNTVPEGNVISQSVKENEDVKRGDSITIVVSSGEKTIEVSNVVGKTRSEAEDILDKQGFAVYVRENSDETVPAGNVISQSPAAGTSQIEGSTITIFVSTGKKDVTVSYNANGGTVSRSSDTRHANDSYGDMPTPTRTGYTFNGWYTEQNGGSAVTSSTKVTITSNHTIYAHWTANSYQVKFDANGGSVSKTNVNVIYGSPYGDLPTPTRNGYGFDGWFTSSNGGSQITSGSTVSITSTQTLYAHWTAGKVTVTFNANGGSTPTGSASVTYNSTYGTLPTPSRAGYNFVGWFTSASGGTQVTSSSTVTNTNSHSLFAHWTAAKYTVSFNANSGTVSPGSIEVTYDSTYGSMPVPTRTGYTFNGWYTAASGGTKVDSNTKVSITANQTLYAQWTLAKFTLTFNANGGSVSESSRQVYYNSEYGQLPTPKKDYNNFIGWFTAAEGGTQITSSTKMGGAAVTIYAHWQLKPLSDWTLASNVPSDAQTVEQKWTYTRTQTKESTNTSESGWTQTGSYWKKTGSGSTNYASFPSGFDTGNYYYQNYAKSAYSASETATTKREVSNNWAGYIYWHWMYSVQYANNLQRAIADRYCVANGISGNGFAYYYFYAIASTVDCPQLGQGYVVNYYVSQTPATYNCYSIIPSGAGSSTDGRGTPRMFRFSYYTSSYTDYQKVFQYQKVTQEESSTQVSNGGEISNVQRYVRYREK